MGTKEQVNCKVLIVDDEEDIILLLSMMLKKLGYTVSISNNGENIDDIISNEQPDIILLDIQMRGVTGSDICKRLKADKSYEGIPVLLISGNHNIEDVAKSCGANDFLAKPIEGKALKNKIEKLVHTAV